MRVMGAASLLPFLLPNCVALPGTAWKAVPAEADFRKNDGLNSTPWDAQGWPWWIA